MQAHWAKLNSGDTYYRILSALRCEYATVLNFWKTFCNLLILKYNFPASKNGRAPACAGLQYSIKSIS